MKTLTTLASVPPLFRGALVSKRGRSELNALTNRLPTLPGDPKKVLLTVSNHLRKEGFSYREHVASLDEVVTSKSGSCLGLTLLVTSMLLCRGKSPSCKILVHPRDAVDRADQKLFTSLMQGEYFDYEHPTIPRLSDQPRREDRINRFVPLCHPVVVLEGTPLETTSLTDDEHDPLIEHQAELSTTHDVETLMSYYFSDKAKSLFSKLEVAARVSRTLVSELVGLIETSLVILPSNRDALVIQWKLGRRLGLEDMSRAALRKLLALEVSDSDLSYKLWIVTGDVKWLDQTLERFPQHIPAFFDRRVFLEKDVREARMNMAVALWCVTYSNVFDLKAFLKDEQVAARMKELRMRN